MSPRPSPAPESAGRGWALALTASELADGRLDLGPAAACPVPVGAVSVQLGRRGPIVLGRVALHGTRHRLESEALGAWLRANFAPAHAVVLWRVGADHLVLSRGAAPWAAAAPRLPIAA